MANILSSVSIDIKNGYPNCPAPPPSIPVRHPEVHTSKALAPVATPQPNVFTKWSSVGSNT